MKVSAGRNHWWMFFGALIFVVALTTVSATAASKSASTRTVYQGETHKGTCCSKWAEAVTINEPDKVVPIVVTWSTDYQANRAMMVGLRLNDGPCTFYGPAFIPKFVPEDSLTYSSSTLQWVIMPGDYKLAAGRNEISVCGGGTYDENDTIVLGFNTLSARLQK